VRSIPSPRIMSSDRLKFVAIASRFEHRPTNSVKDRIDSLAPTASGNLAVDRTETVSTGFGDDELLETLDRIPILGLLELTKILFSPLSYISVFTVPGSMIPISSDGNAICSQVLYEFLLI